MKIVSIKPEQFERFTKNHIYRNFYQTTAYGKTMLKFGYDVQYLGIVNDSNSLIGATLLLYKNTFLNYKIAYAPRGILFYYKKPEQVEELVKLLKKALGKQGFISLRIDPYIASTVRDKNGNIINFNNQVDAIIKNLVNSGFIYKGKTIFFEDEKPRWQAITLLNKDIRTIYSNFDKRTRHKIRKAASSGVEIYKDKNKDIKILYEFIKRKTLKPIEFYNELIKNFGDNVDIYYARLNTETYVINSRKAYEKELARNDFLARQIQTSNFNPKKGNKLLNKKMDSDKLLNVYKNSLVKATELLKKYPQGAIIAGALVINYNNCANIFVDGIDKRYNDLNANYLIKWKMINDYKENGYSYLNLNAVVGEFEKKNKYSSLNESKLGFNPVVTEYIGEFDIILNNFAYNLHKNFNKKK